ncbi:aldo/keto reductase [Micromonospora oryzae]|uniref:aldo/keto reductase n=1 Tax=Micromonospora sp. DSM 102119 TaxID=3111768 RepID=UPI0031E2DBB3
MRYALLGPSGIRVSRIALGTATFGVAPDAACADAVVGAALDAGINLVDTANAYGNLPHFDRPGVPPAAERESAEEILGRALAGRRDDVVLCTKAQEPVGPGVNDRGLSRRHLFAQLDRSLRRLRTDHVDVFYAHHPDPATPLETTLAALDDLVRAGKARHCALSTFPAWQTVHALWICDDRRLHPPVALQVRYHLFARGVEAEIVPLADRFGLSVVAFSPLAGGLLAGAAARTRAHAGESRWGGGAFTPSQQAAAAQVEEIAAAAGHRADELAVAWLLSRPTVAAAIVGAENPEEVAAAGRAAALIPDAEVLARLDAIDVAEIREPKPRVARPTAPGV